jgi:hypothetical protein
MGYKPTRKMKANLPSDMTPELNERNADHFADLNRYPKWMHEDADLAPTGGAFGAGGVQHPVGDPAPAPDKRKPWKFKAPAESLTAKANREDRESEAKEQARYDAALAHFKAVRDAE